MVEIKNLHCFSLNMNLEKNVIKYKYSIFIYIYKLLKKYFLFKYIFLKIVDKGLEK